MHTCWSRPRLSRSQTSLHVVRNGVSTVVQCVLQGLIHPWARGWHGRQRRTFGMHVDDVVVADVWLPRLRHGAVRRERAQRVRRQRIVIARVGGAGAAGHDWYTMRLNHVVTFELQKSMLARGKQALIEHMHCHGHSGMRSIVGVSFVVRKCYSPCFCSEARCGRDGPSAYV